MKEYRRVFLSYANADKPEADRIAADLKQQGFEVWEYAQQWKKSDLGHPAPEEFAELMHRTTWFIPVVSAASVNPSSGKFAVMELEYALELDMVAQKRVFPVVLPGSRPKKWLKPFDALAPLDAVDVDINETRAFLQSIARLCRNLKVVYKPQFRVRLLEPFWQGFAAEIQDLRKTDDNSWRLMAIIEEFIRCYEKKTWVEACGLLSYFLSAVRYEMPARRFFYALIVRAVCETGAGMFTHAEESLCEAGKENADNPALFAARGYLHLRRRDVASSRGFYSEALARLNPVEAPVARFSCLCPLVEMGDALDRADRKIILDADLSSFDREEQVRLRNVREILFYQGAEYTKGVEEFETMRREDLHDTMSVVYAHLCMKELGDQAEAQALLTTAIRESKTNSRLNASDLYFQLAEFWLFSNEPRKAVAVYEKHLLGPGVRTRQLMVRYVRILRKAGDEKRMKNECLKMVGGMFQNPLTCEDFYYEGFARFLLGDVECAQYDYERSGRFGPRYQQLDKE